MATTLNDEDIPDLLLDRSRVRSDAVYIDLNPVPNQGAPLLLHDASAVFASLRNLFMCPPGGRSRIFQPEYFSGLYELLQEPFDDITAAKLSLSVYQAVRRWEPRIITRPSDVQVIRLATLPGYQCSLTIVVNGSRATNKFNLPLTGA